MRAQKRGTHLDSFLEPRYLPLVLCPRAPQGISAHPARRRAENRTTIRVGADGVRHAPGDHRGIMSPAELVQLLEGIAICALFAFTAYVQP
jgi:hypothetical protein